MAMTTGTNTPAILSASRAMGALEPPAWLHHVDDLRQGGVLSHLVRPEFQIALGIDGGGADPVPRLLLHGNALAGKGTLVNAGPAGEHRAVHGDGAAGADDHRVAHLAPAPRER